ncbi:MAG TPA: hypothetical protein VGM82_10865 [Gemmatimonadaceae bacterium]|jgi:hypothetical protein
MNRTNRQLKQAGSAHVIGAWLFLIAALVAGGLGVMHMMPTGATAGTGADCVCLGVLFAAIAAVLALLGIHRQNTVLYAAIVPAYQGSHGSGDDSV